jgi:hypothetical protein
MENLRTVDFAGHDHGDNHAHHRATLDDDVQQHGLARALDQALELVAALRCGERAQRLHDYRLDRLSGHAAISHPRRRVGGELDRSHRGDVSDALRCTQSRRHGCRPRGTTQKARAGPIRPLSAVDRAT